MWGDHGLIIDELVKSRKTCQIQRLRKKLRRQGAQILRNEEYLPYAAMTKDLAQRSIRTFYEVVIIGTLYLKRRAGFVFIIEEGC